jgi:hypothetical protein
MGCFVHVHVLSLGCSCAFEERIVFVREKRSEYEIVQLISMKPNFLICWLYLVVMILDERSLKRQTCIMYPV